MCYTVGLDEFSVISGVLVVNERQALLNVLGAVSGAGRRGLLAVPEVATLARSTRRLDLVHPHVTRGPFLVRAIYFDEPSDGNWLVPWHQSLTLALRSRAEAPSLELVMNSS